MNFGKGSMLSNLERFLRSTAPVVKSRFLIKNDMGSLNPLWYPWEREKLEYFKLSDLWDSYEEWSAYGAGVPVVLDDGRTVTQYYVPYLSAIQIFTTDATLTRFKEETHVSEGVAKNGSTDSISEGTGSDKLGRWDGNSLEEVGLERDSPLISNDRLGFLYFQHFDSSCPYGRVPLVDMINSFTLKYPGLMTLRSVDVSPASWISVAWYPIYHIPMGRAMKELSACFLTFHTISSSFHGGKDGGDKKRKSKVREGVPLPSFGLATYKMHGNLWTAGNQGGDQERLVSLTGVAESWLKQLRIQHHDFNFFTGVRRS